MKTILLPLLKEGVTTTPTSTTAPTPASASAQDPAVQVDCSRAVQALLKHLPELAKTYLLTLAKCPAVTAAAAELGLRVMHLYVTIACLARPVNEHLRLRTAKDMSAIEAAVAAAGLTPVAEDEEANRANPVVDEFRAFRRLLFMDDVTGGSNTTGGSGAGGVGGVGGPPSRGRLLAMPFVADLRPSTLLGHMAACAPPQLPSPTALEAPAGSQGQAQGQAQGQLTINGYVDLLTAVTTTEGSSRLGPLVFPSVCSLYLSPADSRESTMDGVIDWKGVPSEQASWERLLVSLDTFVQRISVAGSAQQKQQMRAWYEALQDMGGYYYAN
jgi:hypothetical protein